MGFIIFDQGACVTAEKAISTFCDGATVLNICTERPMPYFKYTKW